MNATTCCTGDCNQGRACPARQRNAPFHSGNGGNTISDGQAFPKPVYTGHDVIEPPTSWFAVGLFACGLLWVVVMAYRVLS